MREKSAEPFRLKTEWEVSRAKDSRSPCQTDSLESTWRKSPRIQSEAAPLEGVKYSTRRPRRCFCSKPAVRSALR